MKYKTFIFSGLVAAALCGCVSKEDQARLDSMTMTLISARENVDSVSVEMQKINAAIVETYKKVTNKEMSVKDGLALIEKLQASSAALSVQKDELSKKYETLKNDYDALRNSTEQNKYQWWEIVGGILTSILGGMAGVRITRGPSSSPLTSRLVRKG